VSEPKRYAFKVNEENDFDLIEHSNGEYVRYEDYARLKAECQARQAENSVLAVECDSLKAEVERLQSIHSIDSIGIEQLKAEVERLNSELHTCSCANAKMNMHMNENARLKAEVERLTKGIKAIDPLLLEAINSATIAKEGNQS